MHTQINELFLKPFLKLLPFTAGLTLVFVLVYALGVIFVERRRLDELPMAGAVPRLLIGFVAGALMRAARSRGYCE